VLYLKQDITNTVYSNLLDRGYNIGTSIGSNLVLNPDFTELGSEEITNGDFATDSNWTLSSGITYNASKYLDFNSSSGQAKNTPNITFVEGKRYKVVYEIKNYSSGSIKFRFQSGTNTIGSAQSGNGVKTEFIICLDSSNNNFQFFGSSSFVGSIDNVSVKEVGVNWISQDNSVTFALGSAKIDVIYGLNRLKQNNVTGDGLSYRVTYVVSENISTTQLSFYSGLGYTILDGTVGTHTFDYTRTGTNDNVIFTAANGTSITLTSISFQRITETPFSWLIRITNDFTKDSTTLLQIPDTNVIITPGTNTVSYPITVITTGTANGLNQEALLKDTGFYSYEIYKQDSLTNLDINDAVVGKLVESGKALIYNADSEVTYKEQPDGNPNNFIYVPD